MWFVGYVNAQLSLSAARMALLEIARTKLASPDVAFCSPIPAANHPPCRSRLTICARQGIKVVRTLQEHGCSSFKAANPTVVVCLVQPGHILLLVSKMTTNCHHSYHRGSNISQLEGSASSFDRLSSDYRQLVVEAEDVP